MEGIIDAMLSARCRNVALHLTLVADYMPAIEIIHYGLRRRRFAVAVKELCPFVWLQEYAYPVTPWFGVSVFIANHKAILFFRQFIAREYSEKQAIHFTVRTTDATYFARIHISKS